MDTGNEKKEFWETAFSEKKEMWGFEPARSAVLTMQFFADKNVKSILVPGIGYGRNAQLFREAGMEVTGIEISQTAIDMAKNLYGDSMTIYHGSVTDMPFDNNKYEGIFCYALIHLLDTDARKKLIIDCYDQLEDDGYMVFTVVTKQAQTYGQGKLVSKDRYEIFDGVNMFFMIAQQYRKSLEVQDLWVYQM